MAITDKYFSSDLVLVLIIPMSLQIYWLIPALQEGIGTKSGRLQEHQENAWNTYIS